MARVVGLIPSINQIAAWPLSSCHRMSLWPSQSLRQALVLLRKELGHAYFVADTKLSRLQPDLWSIDVHEFDRLRRSSNPAELERAGQLFGGEFLNGLNIDEEGFGEWLNNQRLRWQLAAAQLCETYAARPELVTDGRHAMAMAERLIALDPLREDWQRIALILYALCRQERGACPCGGICPPAAARTWRCPGEGDASAAGADSVGRNRAGEPRASTGRCRIRFARNQCSHIIAIGRSNAVAEPD
jgi:hypothetical protein